MIREICFFAVTMVCVGLYIAWRERRVRRSVERTIALNVSELNAGNPNPQQNVEFGTVMQLAVGAATQRSLADQKLLSQVNQLLASRG